MVVAVATHLGAFSLPPCYELSSDSGAIGTEPNKSKKEYACVDTR